MPHICTRCNSVFQSGEDILKGCPECGWKKFVFARTVPAADDPSTEQIITKAMGVRQPPGRRARDRYKDKVEAEGKPAEGAEKDTAKGNIAKDSRARNKKAKKKAADDNASINRPVKEKSSASLSMSDKAGENLSKEPFSPSTGRQQGAHTGGDNAGDHEARGDKLESIKITAPGTYELNLPSLFERDELIMAIKEGTYFIDLTSAFRKGKKE